MAIKNQSYAQFNLYDIFSNFLPGSILLIGFLFPIVGAQGLLVDFKIGSLIILAILSFAAGLAIQVIAGTISSGSENFRERMAEVVDYDEVGEENDRESTGGTEMDINYLEACRSQFGYSAQFEDWGRLYKDTLASLEQSPRTRALRLQALYLAMRGMSVTMFGLFVYYCIYLYLVKALSYETEISPSSLEIFAVVCLLLAIAFFTRQGEFRDDMTTYMISDFYQQHTERESQT